MMVYFTFILEPNMLTQPTTLAAYLYRHQGQAMPSPILDESGEIDVAADDAALAVWSSQTENFTVDLNRLERFILRVEVLLDDLIELELDPDIDASQQYMSLVYDAGRDVFDQDTTQLREFFRWFYLVVFQRPEGPRWGDFINVYGVEQFSNFVTSRFTTLPGN